MRQAALLAALSLTVAVVTNQFRPQHLELLRPYEGLGPFTVLDPVVVHRLGRQVNFLDVRTAREFQSEHIPHSRNLSTAQVAAGLRPAPRRDAVLVVYCGRPGCLEASEMAWQLLQEGYSRVFLLGGGLDGWKQAHLPVESGP